MEFSDYYAILGISPEARTGDLRQAYRLAARRFHPDVNKAPGSALTFKIINEAYEVLSNSHERSQYDKIWQDRAVINPSLSVEAMQSRHHLRRLDEPQVLYVLLKIQPMLEMSLTSDAPLNICLVIDRSTSMKGSRLQHVKNAAQRFVDETSEQDYFSTVTFSDRSEVLIPSQHPTDPRSLKSLISQIRADGATAMYEGLKTGLSQVEKHRNTRFVNHMILITDGRTYGDEEDCLSLASEAHMNGIGISGMGIGQDWNDRFLDDLVSRTGGDTAYINSMDGVSRFLKERVRRLATAYAERAQITVAPAPDVTLESVVRIAPSTMTFDAEKQPVPLGSLDGKMGAQMILQFHINTGEELTDDFLVARIDLRGEVLGSGQRVEHSVTDIRANVMEDPPEETPPPELLDSLSNLALYKLQDKARNHLEDGNVAEATRSLEYLATRLFENGQEGLGQAALHEARQVARTQKLSEEGIKQLKYGTRALSTVMFGEIDG